ncbi:hypothetical protein PsYK624_075790 [Phanerochaete sordida]|uniref:Uncharacterized protein n=1 Tax=Phanerochaete sordida TaxID=48140 RepID=A0A9P3GCQ0_9APHY|nr:hypothetical protein PsYK624_075790 [Phanerochaete sordida]
MSPIIAQNLTDDSTYNSTDGSFGFDPILRYRPSFACSLPIQILMIGIVLTLTSVLLIHLVFTAQYHWPLAPVNYALQLSAVITLLVSLIATLHVVLDTATQESREWPYMLTYIAVDIPPLQDQESTAGWRTGELAAWLLMNATTSALIQITHIQFLTLLFPSHLERRLIFILLGPLAIMAAIMQLVPLNDSSTDGKLTSIASAVQNVCNATLSLLFTASLFIWGFLVNRKSAWRTDGGTAAFGVGALMLALASTAITFIYIPSKDHYSWMPGLMWAVILWQSFLGWWWWVGSGMGVGEVDELVRREEKRRRKRKARLAARQIRREKAQTLWRGVTGVFGYDKERRRGGSLSCSGGMHEDAGTDEPRGHNLHTTTTADSADTCAGPSSRASTSSGSTADAFVRKLQQYYAIRHLYAAYLRLRHAHLTASRAQAEENSERIQQVYGPTEDGGEVDPGTVGWGLGSYGVRQMGREDVQEREEGLRGILEIEEEDDHVSDDGSSVDSRREPKTDADFEGQPGNARRRKNRLARRDTDPRSEGTLPQHTRAEPAEPQSMWYWGPLRRWRLRDSTVYA